MEDKHGEGEYFCLGEEQKKGETGAEINRELDIRKPPVMFHSIDSF
jgi:hypothetical protein